MERIEARRALYARLVAEHGGLPPGSEIEAAFAEIPREKFVAGPPWKIFTRAGYEQAPPDDPAVLYEDVLVSLGTAEPINNGQPSLHALCLNALAIHHGEAAVHVGAGMGYYTALMSRLVGDEGHVDAYEIVPELAERATENLAEYANVQVHARSGAEGPLPACDVLYVNAGATEPLACWLDALRPGGRLLFPLTGTSGMGAMLLVTRQEQGYGARFISPAQFIGCVGARAEDTERKLAEVFHKGHANEVKSLRREGEPDASCWFAGAGWWLSTEAVAAK
jgi:protein-L-isoaspartate(D-aspartate) O-methyltransferase